MQSCPPCLAINADQPLFCYSAFFCGELLKHECVVRAQLRCEDPDLA